MMMKRRLGVVSLVILSVAGISSAQRIRDPGGGGDPPPIFKAPDAGFDTEAMKASIVSQLNGRVVGYGYAILDSGAIVENGAGGFKRVPFIDGGVPFQSTTKVNVMSVSKTVTAIALLQLMELHGVVPEDDIGDWLPASWELGLGFDDGITFRDLLRHCTGVKESILQLDEDDPAFEALSPNKYDGLQALAEHGIYPEFAGIGAGDNYSTCSYKNANFNFARILIWQMAVEAGSYSNNNELSAEVNSSAIYQAYVRDEVLAPSGVLDGYCYSIESEDDRELYYDANWNIIPMLFSGGRLRGGFDGLFGCGAVNWHLSAVDLIRVMKKLRYSGLLSAQARGWMDEHEMGWSRGSEASYYLAHGGLYKKGATVPALAAPLTPWNPTPMWRWFETKVATRMHACVAKFDGGIDAALVINSSIRGASKDACGVLTTAYNAAK